MSSIGTGYDLSATTFSPDGRVFQVEYANKAVENSGTAIGLCCKDGLVFGVEKVILSKLWERNSNRRLATVDRHVGMAVAGLAADARQLVKYTRGEASSYRSFYGSEIPTKVLCDRVSGHVQMYTLFSHVRPFGTAAILGAFESDGPKLYMIEPSGVSWGYYGVAVGKGKQNAKTEIEKLKLSELTVKQAVNEVARIIYSTYDEVKDKEFELELSWISEETNREHRLVDAVTLEEAERLAKAAMEEDSDED